MRVGVPRFSSERFAATARADFRFAPLNALLLVVLMLIGMTVHLMQHGFAKEPVVFAVVAALLLVITFRNSQIWEAVVICGTVVALAGYLYFRQKENVSPVALVLATIVASLAAPALQIAYQWERGVVLRFGRFRGIRGPGLFLIVPIVDKVAQYVDQRIRVSDFRAETTLTKDTVPVNVDAIAFWMVWDAEKSVLEVEDLGGGDLVRTDGAARCDRAE